METSARPHNPELEYYTTHAGMKVVLESKDVVLQRVFALGRDGSHGRVLALVSAQQNKETMVEFFSDSPEPLILHWGVSRTKMGEWTLPDIEIMHEPTHSEIIANKACETEFKMAPGQLLSDLLSSEEADNGASEGNPSTVYAYLQRACLHFKKDADAIALPFVVRTNNSKQVWFKDYWGNYLLPLQQQNNADSAGAGTKSEAAVVMAESQVAEEQ